MWHVLVRMLLCGVTVDKYLYRWQDESAFSDTRKRGDDEEYGEPEEESGSSQCSGDADASTSDKMATTNFEEGAPTEEIDGSQASACGLYTDDRILGAYGAVVSISKLICSRSI